MKSLRSTMPWIVVGLLSFFLSKRFGCAIPDAKDLVPYSLAVATALAINAGLIAALLRTVDSTINQDLDRRRQDRLQKLMNRMFLRVVVRWVITVVAAAVAFFGGKVIDMKMSFFSTTDGIGMVGSGTFVGLWAAILSFVEFVRWRRQLQEINREIRERKQRHEHLARLNFPK